MTNINEDIFNALKDRMGDKFPILLDGYLQDAHSYLETIQDNIPYGDIDTVIEATHSLKSASGLLGLQETHHCAEKLEYLCKQSKENGDLTANNITSLYTDLQQAYSNTKAFLLP